MSLSDDDDVDPQFKDVDEYYFEESKGNPICFSVLPLQFEDNDEVTNRDSKKVDLHGVADGGLHKVYKQVTAWRVWLHSEQPKISVLSTEGIWIELLNPRKCYEKTVRSILITVQMLHYFRRFPTRLKQSLSNHLSTVFSKFDIRPAEDDLRKHYPLIKLFSERDPALRKSKILQRFMKETPGEIKEPKKYKHTEDEEPFIEDSLASSNDNNDDYDCKDDYSWNGDDEDGDYDSSDGYSHSDDDDTDDDGHGTDPVCAICDNGGKLLSCVGQCKRSFHPRKVDGKEANCDTLGYSSAQLKEIGTYLCKNCQYKQHQCFECGELEPSDGPNVKVFQCNNESCGHFYHPKCVAKLLDPDDTDGACELEKRIKFGMPFTCPVHWCCECKSMEDRTRRSLHLAVCRRCPRSYHKKCLPREISFKKTLGTPIRAWELSNGIIIYCKRHDIVPAIGTPCRDHIKVPSSDIDQTRDFDKKRIEVLENNPDMDADKNFRDGKNKDTSRTSSRNKLGIPIEEAVHEEQEQKNDQAILLVEKHSEADQNCMSGIDMDTQEVHKERTSQSKDNEFGSSNKGTPDHVDDLSPDRQVQAAYVKETSITYSTGTLLQCSDGDQEVNGSYTCQQKHKSPQCSSSIKSAETDSSGKSIKRRVPHEMATDSKRTNPERNRENVQMKDGRNQKTRSDGDQEAQHNRPHRIGNIKATEIDTSDKSVESKQPNEKATGKRESLDRNRENVRMKNGRAASYNDQRTVHPQAPNGPQRRQRGPHAPSHKFRNNGFNDPWQNDHRRVAEPVEYGSREQRRSTRREEESRNTNCMKANSHWDTYMNSYGDSLLMERRHPRKRPRDYSWEGQRMDHHENYCRTDGHRRHDGYIDHHHGHRRRRSPHRSAFPLPEYSPDRRQRSPHWPPFSSPGFDDGGRWSQFYARPEIGASRGHDPQLYTRPEHVDRIYRRRSDPPYYGHGDGECYDFEYDEMDRSPARYPPHDYDDAYGACRDCNGEYAEVYGRCDDHQYGVGSGYPQERINRGLRHADVTDLYGPRLAETNHEMRGHSRGSRQYVNAMPPAMSQHGLYY